MDLIIVESPNKVKKIKKIVSTYGHGNFVVLPTCGHLFNLKKKFDILNPQYEIIPKKQKYVTAIKNEFAKCTNIYIASDMDRSGEGIAGEIVDLLKLDINKTKRIIFNEISDTAIISALKNPTTVNMNKVHSNRCRQILDHEIGFKISPILWKYVKSRTSAGRVQTPTTSLIIERENKIQQQSANKYYFKTEAIFDHTIKSTLNTKFKTKEEATKFLEQSRNFEFKVTAIDEHESYNSPPPPFITSTLQQSINKSFGLSTKTIMQIAQSLFEKGLITYHRTDSQTISQQAINEIKNYITTTYSNDYSAPNRWGYGEGAHECIRPVHITNNGFHLKDLEKKVYNAIWTRTVASQMIKQKVHITTIKISAPIENENFMSIFEKTLFDGFTILYNRLQSHTSLPNIKTGDLLKLLEMTSTQLFEKRKSRFTEATLVKELQKRGLGRPSTYATIVSVIQERQYVEKKDITLPQLDFVKLILKSDSVDEQNNKTPLLVEKQRLVPTTIGIITTQFLLQHFNKIFEYEFTASVETQLDNVALGTITWQQVVQSIADLFNPIVIALKSQKVTNKLCIQQQSKSLGKDEHGNEIILATGRYGSYLKCGKKTQSLDKSINFDTINTYDDVQKHIYPRIIGKYDNHDVVINSGKFGIYFQYNGENISKRKIRGDTLEKFVLFMKKRQK